MAGVPRERLTVTDPVSSRVVMWAGFPLAGAALGWLLKLLAGWAAELEWVPKQKAIRFIAELPEPQGTIGALAVGAVAGLALAMVGRHEQLLVHFEDDAVTIDKDGRQRRFTRGEVAGVCLSGKELVLFDAETGELARERTDADPARLRKAFGAYGYTWLDNGDPYADRFTWWTEDSPGLPPGANGLLKARQRALEKDGKDAREDAVELRAELRRLGVVVRDRKKRQYWRTTGQSIKD